MDENTPEQDQRKGSRFPGMVVVVSGLFGLGAAGMMYLDAVSKGEGFLQDSLMLIAGAAILGAVTLIFGLYLYIRNNK